MDCKLGLFKRRSSAWDNQSEKRQSCWPWRNPSAPFQGRGELLTSNLTRLLRIVWNEEKHIEEWSSLTVIPIFKQGTRTMCENHRGISLVSVASKILSGLILRRLIQHREPQTRENQAGFRPGRGCIDHIFVFRQILELCHSFQQPTMVLFLDLKSAFGSVDCQAVAMLGYKRSPHQIFVPFESSVR